MDHSLIYGLNSKPLYDVTEYVTSLCLPQKDVWKLRVEYGLKSVRNTLEPYRVRNIRSLQLIESGISYDYKFTDRSGILALSKERGEADDILIHTSGLIRDTSYANVIFWDGTDWLTPDTPLLKGTKRAKLLAENKIREERIHIKDLIYFKKINLINAFLDPGEMELDIKKIMYSDPQ